MKFIDEKGRFLGRINVIDILLISILVLGMMTVYFAVTHPSRISRIITGESHYRDVSVSIVLDQGTEWIYSDINIGDQHKGRFNVVIAEIMHKDWMVIEGVKYAVVELKVKTQIEVGGVLTFCGRVLKPGEAFIFDSGRIRLRGYVFNVKNQ